VERDCPACGGDGTPEFDRIGFPYLRCGTCRSLFVSPVPDGDRLARYHADGAAERVRRERVLSMTAEVRARHALTPRVRWVLAAAAARLGPGLTFAQFGAEFPVLLEQLRGSVSIVPWPDEGRAASEARIDCAIAFDALERSANFSHALHQCRQALRPHGLLFVTTMSCDGFEVRMLGPRTAAIVPPVHLQLLSRVGWLAGLAREGFGVIEYSTQHDRHLLAVRSWQ
jgi:hypothetical protein